MGRLAPERVNMRRREFIAILTSAAASWPLAAHAQQQRMPVVGFLRHAPAAGSEYLLNAFKRGLAEVGFVDGQNVIVELGASEGRRERLTELAAEFASRPVALIAASATSATIAASATTPRIPIVFAFPNDPVELGLVQSMNRPGRNLTGISYLNTELTGKRIGILRELLPDLSTMAVLITPSGANANETLKEVDEAVRALSIKAQIYRAATSADIDRVFDELRATKAGALLVGNDAYFTTQRARLVGSATKIGVPAIYAQREFAEAGGLISYGANIAEAYRLAGIYAGRVLKGEPPADLPVIQPTKFELVINLKAIKALNLQISDRVLALADEVIE